MRSVPLEERTHRLREQTDCGHPDATTTSGLVAYLDGESAGCVQSSPARRTSACCAPASRGPDELKTRPTTASGQ
ncbi:MAG TPA: hypothetical protein VEL02_12385 [Jatrophihabitantaceae bacterium]|nr:hypothetical protein [Jatrophihabitantaceae bacterium]